MTETYTATVDRIVDDRTAVVLLEGDGSVGGQSGDGADDRNDETDDRNDEADDRNDEVDVRSGDDADDRDDEVDDRTDGPVEQLEVDAIQLPADARHGGAVLEVVVDNGSLCEATYRPDETASRRESAQERLDRLSERLSDRD